MSDTPKTDAAEYTSTEFVGDGNYVVRSSFARQLERRIAELERELEETREYSEKRRKSLARILRERDAARKVLGEFLASGVEHDDPRMDYITMQIDRVTLAAARAAEEER